MNLALALFLVFLAVFCHELGHAFAMRRYGVEVAELGIGLSFPPTLRWQGRSSQWLLGSNASFAISPWLLGAYVSPVDKKFAEKLDYSEQAHINGAGIITNLALTGTLLCILQAIVFFEKGYDGRSFWLAFGLAFCTGVVLIKARILCAWVMPIVSLVAIGFFVWIFWGMSKSQFLEGSGGFVATGVLASELVSNPKQAIFFGAIASLALALTNVLPFFPLDGGRTWTLIIQKVAPRLSMPLQIIGVFVSLALVILSVFGDVRHLLRWWF